jgi:hypothetical protein
MKKAGCGSARGAARNRQKAARMGTPRHAKRTILGLSAGQCCSRNMPMMYKNLLRFKREFTYHICARRSIAQELRNSQSSARMIGSSRPALRRDAASRRVG